MPGGGRGGRVASDGEARVRRIMAFAVIEGAFLLLVTIPVLLWLFVLPNGLSEGDLTRYAVGIVVLQLAVSGLLLWKFRLIPGPRTDKKDAR